MKNKLPTVAAALFALLAVVETGNALLAPGRAPSVDDWNAASADVRAKLAPGDLIVFAPHWVDEIGRAHLGDVMPLEMVAHADSNRYARVWEVSIRGERAPETAGARLVEETRHGKVRVALYEKPAAAIAYDFTTHAADARVTQTLGGAETPCLRDANVIAFRCAGTRVEPRTLEMSFLPRRGLLVPVDGARVTNLEWSETTLGRSLVVHAGIHDYYLAQTRRRRRALPPLHRRPRATERQVGNDDGWRRFDVDTSVFANTRHTVHFDVSSNDPEWRTFGFHAEARQ